MKCIIQAFEMTSRMTVKIQPFGRYFWIKKLLLEKVSQLFVFLILCLFICFADDFSQFLLWIIRILII